MNTMNAKVIYLTLYIYATAAINMKRGYEYIVIFPFILLKGSTHEQTIDLATLDDSSSFFFFLEVKYLFEASIYRGNSLIISFQVTHLLIYTH